jgi:hypothetical protein
LSAVTLLLLYIISLVLGSSIYTLTDADKTKILLYHNEIRDNYGLPNLVWNNTWEKTASDYAGKCVWAHSGLAGCGENLATNGASSVKTFPLATWMDQINGWYQEYKYWTCSSNACTSVCGHLTQLVSKSSVSVGCGVARCDKGTVMASYESQFLVCQYYPPGNVNLGTQHPVTGKAYPYNGCPAKNPDLTDNYTPPSTPTQQPTAPTQQPTAPTQQPTVPTQQPTAPTQQPTAPTQQPSAPTQQPTVPTQQPSAPTQQPSAPTQQPTVPTQQPTVPTQQPTVPTQQPSAPTQQPTVPTQQPTAPSRYNPSRPTPVKPTPSPVKTPTKPTPSKPTPTPSKPTSSPSKPTASPTADWTGCIGDYWPNGAQKLTPCQGAPQTFSSTAADGTSAKSLYCAVGDPAGYFWPVYNAGTAECNWKASLVDESDAMSGSGSLSTGAWVGIAIGIVAIVIVAIVIVLLVKRKPEDERV